MSEYINDQCRECFHFQVCAQVMKNQLFIRNKMLKEESPKCEHFIPAADVIDVVRCKNCKFWDAVKNPKHEGKGICKPPNRSLGGYCTRRGATLEDDYCSYGERKESED